MKFGSLIIAGAALLLSDLVAGQTADRRTLDNNYPQTANLPTGWRYLGCYSDRKFSDVGDRALGGYFRLANPQGGSACINVCKGINPNYKYAGTEDNQCWCDTGLNNNGTTTYGQKLPEAYCNYACRGSQATSPQTCGNVNTGTTKETGPALSIYTSEQVSGFSFACVLVLVLVLCVASFCSICPRTTGMGRGGCELRRRGEVVVRRWVGGACGSGMDQARASSGLMGKQCEFLLAIDALGLGDVAAQYMCSASGGELHGPGMACRTPRPSSSPPLPLGARRGFGPPFPPSHCTWAGPIPAMLSSSQRPAKAQAKEFCALTHPLPHNLPYI
ncbi:unnamed protein product [Periconia digitata]|uniref:WSC domain-containing protein n=1 Tax=Periconia digitata TaxID=1303443 RepID=A0A9W4XX86_9PLEO|nr:unnamed protein product [Periconia digitata]